MSVSSFSSGFAQGFSNLFAPNGTAANKTDSLLGVPNGTPMASGLPGSLGSLSNYIFGVPGSSGSNTAGTSYFDQGFPQIFASIVVAIIGFMMVSASIKTPAIITQAVNLAGKVSS